MDDQPRSQTVDRVDRQLRPIKRWQEFTGEKATLDGDGRTFEEIAAERLPAAA
jgi:hypothetical protein